MTRLALVAGAVALAAAPAAWASSAPASQVRALAAAAGHDPRALARLEAIDRVDGRPMDLRALLAGSSGAELHARLRLLATGPAAAEIGGARRQAAAILHEKRFRGSSTPRPLHRFLVWFGHGLDRLGHWLGWPFRKLGIRGPQAGGWWAVLWGVIAGAVVAAAVAVTIRLARRRGGLHVDPFAPAGGRAAGEDPSRLERQADEAERAGDLTTALRLRFRAGLLRLARARVIPARSSVTTGEVRRAVRSPEFDELARAFDEVVYGSRPARPDDLEQARTRWPRVLEAATAS